MVPVRAVPFVTGGGISPLGIAQLLANPEYMIKALFVDAATGAVHEMLQKNWIRIMLSLKEAEANAQGAVISDVTVAFLPASTYIYLDDLKGVYAEYYCPSREDLIAYTQQERENFQLQHYAYIEKNLVNLVFEGCGIQSQSVLDTPASVLATSTFRSTSTVPQSIALPLAVKPSWSIEKPKRRDPLTGALMTLLTTIKSEGNARPKARDILDSFKVNKPAEVLEVLGDELKHYTTNGKTKIVTLGSLQKRLNKLLK